MSLVKKIKDILFEEEEITEPIKTVVPEEKKVEYVAPVAPKIEKEEVETAPKREVNSPSERELFKVDSSAFKFPDFDEEEFQSSLPKRSKQTNVLEYERKKSIEKRTDYGRYERIETKEIVEKKKFKPSPIISPVYGVLNQDYRPEDVKDKNEVVANSLNLDEVRKKAFEPEELIVPDEIDEPVVTFFEEKESSRVVKKPSEEMKTIDELLESASEEEIILEDELEMPLDTNIDVIEDELENFYEESKKEAEPNLEDTLESDLFELIDSMYETREDGE